MAEAEDIDINISKLYKEVLLSLGTAKWLNNIDGKLQSRDYRKSLLDDLLSEMHDEVTKSLQAKKFNHSLDLVDGCMARGPLERVW